MAIMKLMVTEPQGKIMTSPKRNRIVNAGRRFGKSFFSGYEMLIQAVNHPNSEILYVAPTLPMARDIMWRGWLKKHVPEQYIEKKNEQMMIMEFKNGSVIQLKSADNEDSLRGTALDFLVLDEAAMYKNGELLWETISINLSDRLGRSLIISTPKGYNWFYDLYQKAKYDPEYQDEWDAFQFTTMEGGNVSPEEIEKKRKTMTKKMFDQEFNASFETMSNRIYYNYDRDLNSCDMVDWYGAEGTEVHVGIDFNVNPMTATFWAKDKDRRHEEIAVCFDEICEPNSDTQELANMIKKRYPGRQIICYPDPTCRKRQTNAVGGVSDMDILIKNGFDVYVPHAPYATKDKFNTVNTRLCDAEGHRHLFIVKDRCPHLRKSWEGYTYRETMGTSEPDKSGGLDHISDAAAYFINYAYPMKENRISRPQILGV